MNRQRERERESEMKNEKNNGQKKNNYISKR